MGINRENVGSILVLIPGDSIEVMTAPAFEKALLEAVNELHRNIIVDMTDVTYVSSVGLGAFVKGAKRAGECDCRLALCGLTGEPRKVFEKTNIHLLFEVFPSRSEAIVVMKAAATAGAIKSGSNRLQAPIDSAAAPALTLQEEILLLALKEEDGRYIDLPPQSLDHALAGAVLMELCLCQRIDLDLQRLVCVDPTPVGDDLLDPILRAIAQTDTKQSAQNWIRLLVRDAKEIERRVINRLVARNVLQKEASGLRRVLRGHRHPMADHKSQRAVKDRILGVIQSEEIPLPRDIVIIALAEACAVFDALLDDDAVTNARQRILEIAGMDLVALSMLEVLFGVQREGDTAPPEIDIFSSSAEEHDVR